MNDTAVLPLLSAMFAPVILINACGLFVLSTAQRLSRQLDRVRSLTSQAEALAAKPDAASGEKREFLAALLEGTARRAHILQQALTALYVSVGFFVAVVVAIGAARILGISAAWPPLVLTLAGVASLMCACILLLLESRAAFDTVRRETARALELVR